MKKNRFAITIIFPFFLIVLLLASCGNPFFGYTDSESPGIPIEPLPEPPAPEPEPEPAAVPCSLRFSALIAENAMPVNAEYNAPFLLLSTDEGYDKYYWKLGDALVSSESSCKIDLSLLAKACYPVVLLAEKNNLLYSALYYFDPSLSGARTLFPFVKTSSLSDFLLRIFRANETEEWVFVSECTEKDAESLSALEILLGEGEYRFELSARSSGFIFSGSRTLCVKDNEQQTVDFELHITQGYSEEVMGGTCGKVDVVNYFMTDSVVSDASITLYKESGGNFILCDVCSFSAGTLPFYKGRDFYEGVKYVRYSAELEPGAYWLRCDARCGPENKASYLMEILYVSAGAVSEKILETSDFYTLYTIDYNMNGGFFTGSSLVESAASFDSFPLPSEEEMKKPGFTFEGWYLDEQYLTAVKNYFYPGDLREDMVLYAHWLPCEDSGKDEVKAQRLSVDESKNSLGLVIQNVSADDIFVIKVFNSAEKLCDVQYDDFSFADGCCVMRMGLRCHKGNYFLIEVSAFQKYTLIGEKSIQKLRFTERVLFCPEYDHF